MRAKLFHGTRDCLVASVWWRVAWHEARGGVAYGVALLAGERVRATAKLNGGQFRGGPALGRLFGIVRYLRLPPVRLLRGGPCLAGQEAQQAQLVGLYRCLCAGGDAQFGEDVGDVDACCLGGDDQGGGDFPVGLAGGH